MHRAYRALWQWFKRHHWLALACIIAGVALLVFTEVAEEVADGSLTQVDRLILDFLRPHRSDMAHTLAIWLSALFAWPYAVLISLPFVLYLACTRRRRTLRALILAPVGTLLMVALIKMLFSRERPATAVVEEFGHSFPSGHATGGTVLYGLLGYIALRFMTKTSWVRAVIVVITMLLIVGTGLARIYLEVHYVSDVCAGWAAGAFILMGTISVLETWPRGE